MPQMNYFRRFSLAGKSLRRPTQATLRGNKRRLDIDGNSPVPYFPGVTNGATLTVEGAGGVQVTVGIPANVSDQAGLATTITALNAALGPASVFAFDDGGCIGLRSTVSGGTGVVKVVGGTAAEALGFDLKAQSFFASGGDLATAPEGRGFGQPSGAAATVPGENLTSDAFVRALGRVMANTDVLYADLMRGEVAMKKVATVSVIGTTASYADLGAQKVFVGFSQTISKEDLAHLFFVMDSVTKQMSQYRVTKISSTTSSSPIHGLDQQVLAPTAITNIKNGSVVECSTANFPGAGVQVGDYVEITGAANTSPFSNNGYRWVVDEIVDTTHLSLRPMSVVELQTVGETLDENQPTIELNSTQAGSWGQLSVSRGPYAADTRVWFENPLPVGAVVDIWAPVPMSMRERSLNALSERGYGVFSSMTHNYDPAPNAILSRPTVSAGATTFGCSPFMVRWHGRPIRVPEFGPFTPGAGVATWYLYWDENDCLVKASTSLSDIFVTEARQGSTPEEIAGLTPNTAGKGHLIGVFTTTAPGAVTLVSNTSRVIADETMSMTVGRSGQFRDLAEALEFVRRYVVSGLPRANVELVIISNQTTPSGNGWTLPGCPLHIRGGSPRVGLFVAGGGGYLFNGTAADYLLLSDVSVELTSVTKFICNPNVGYWWTRNIVDVSSPSVAARTLDSSSYTDIGATSVGVSLGRLNYVSAVRGSLTVAQNATVVGDIKATATTSKVQVGADTAGTASIRISTDGTQGRLVASKVGESDITVTKDDLDLLNGGTSSDADPRHTHGAMVKLTGAQTIAGVKTFSSIPVAPASDPTQDNELARKKYVDDQNVGQTNSLLATMGAADAQAVKLTGDQTVAGVKTFSSGPIVPALGLQHALTRAADKGFVEWVALASGAGVLEPDTFTYLQSSGVDWDTGTMSLSDYLFPRNYANVLPDIKIVVTYYGDDIGSWCRMWHNGVLQTANSHPSITDEYYYGSWEGGGADLIGMTEWNAHKAETTLDVNLDPADQVLALGWHGGTALTRRTFELTLTDPRSDTFRVQVKRYRVEASNFFNAKAVVIVGPLVAPPAPFNTWTPDPATVLDFWPMP